MTSSLNNAATMSMDDFFTTNKYRGKIYKTTNRLGKTLAQICDGDTAKMSAEQKRIEAELEAFRNNIFGDKAKRDSLDSIANSVDPKVAKKTKRSSKDTTADKSEKATKKTRGAKNKTSGGSSSARVSVRRQRH